MRSRQAGPTWRRLSRAASIPWTRSSPRWPWPTRCLAGGGSAICVSIGSRSMKRCGGWGRTTTARTASAAGASMAAFDGEDGVPTTMCRSRQSSCAASWAPASTCTTRSSTRRSAPGAFRALPAIAPESPSGTESSPGRPTSARPIRWCAARRSQHRSRWRAVSVARGCAAGGSAAILGRWVIDVGTCSKPIGSKPSGVPSVTWS
mmetsp:Transcript_33214/g.94448  ORF Transcript_33214/g.94448 Transcript_33214/m.94448 type:complete len:205 (-) Transcript_33214:504-1118(-)